MYWDSKFMETWVYDNHHEDCCLIVKRSAHPNHLKSYAGGSINS
jgi:hypothetical protein